ncbi:MAG: glycerophosphodiester phosphodiesterase family protein [Porticoccaceae bacterium]
MTAINKTQVSFNASQLVAHRGYRFKYPENTKLSLLKAIEAGAIFIELDVQFSRDKLPIIYHDCNLLRVSGKNKSVFDINRSSLITETASESDRLGQTFQLETISPLEDLVSILTQNPAVTAFVELKDESISHCGREEMINKTAGILYEVAENTVIMSFDYQLCLKAREISWPQVGVVLERWSDLNCEIINQIEPDYIFVDQEMIPRDCDLKSCELLQKSNLVAYEIDDIQIGNNLLERGVDILETYEIGKFLGIS